MDENEKILELQHQIEELIQSLKIIAERQNSQYTDIMLAIKRLKTRQEVKRKNFQTKIFTRMQRK